LLQPFGTAYKLVGDGFDLTTKMFDNDDNGWLHNSERL
jgi:hypothetical protein